MLAMCSFSSSVYRPRDISIRSSAPDAPPHLLAVALRASDRSTAFPVVARQEWFCAGSIPSSSAAGGSPEAGGHLVDFVEH